MQGTSLSLAFPVFQLTLPIRGAICAMPTMHAITANFNSRSPYGERFIIDGTKTGRVRFQLTLPIRGAINHNQQHDDTLRISTHAPHTGSDRGTPTAPKAKPSFQLTLPIRGAIGRNRHDGWLLNISTHAPHTGSDGENEILNPPCGHVPISPYLEYRAQDKLRTLCHFSNRREVEILDSCPNSTRNKVRACPTHDENYRFAPNDKFLYIIHYHLLLIFKGCNMKAYRDKVIALHIPFRCVCGDILNRVEAHGNDQIAGHLPARCLCSIRCGRFRHFF